MLAQIEANRGDDDTVGQSVTEHWLRVDGLLIEVRTVKYIAWLCDYSVRHIQRLCDEGELIAHKSDGMYWIQTTEIEKLALKRLPF